MPDSSLSLWKLPSRNSLTVEFDGRTENLHNAENGAEGVGQSQISWLDLDFVSKERYQESEYG
jgi:hypothetical protein